MTDLQLFLAVFFGGLFFYTLYAATRVSYMRVISNEVARMTYYRPPSPYGIGGHDRPGDN